MPGPPSRGICRKVSFQGHNRMARVNFETRPCWSRAGRFNHSTTLPTFAPNNVAGTLVVHKHNNYQYKATSDVPAVQSTENKRPPKKKRKNAEAVAWKKKTSLKEILEATAVHLADSHPHLTLLESVALLRLLFNDYIQSLIACETERYASQRNEAIHVTKQEIKVFIGILLLTGYSSRPRQRLYWSKDDDINCPLISSSMSRKI